MAKKPAANKEERICGYCKKVVPELAEETPTKHNCRQFCRPKKGKGSSLCYRKFRSDNRMQPKRKRPVYRDPVVTSWYDKHKPLPRSTARELNAEQEKINLAISRKENSRPESDLMRARMMRGAPL